MRARTRLAALAPSDEAEFLSAVERSAKLHKSWVSPPRTRKAFRASVERMQGPINYAFVVRRTDTNALAGYIEITNVV